MNTPQKHSRRVNYPYPGLRAFERHESRIFFGRQQQINELLERLKQHKFLAVLGASGSGKSSLIKAGLLPGLEKGYMGEIGSQWSIAEMRPGDRPFNRLAESLLADPHFQSAWLPETQLQTQAQLTENETALLSAELQRGRRSLHEVLNIAPLPTNTRLLILVDQFEEIFRFREQQQNQAAAFVSLLLEASQHNDIYIVITMRSDFLGDTAEFHGLPEAINNGLYLTPRLTRDQLREAIRLPVRLFGKEIDDQLVNALLNDAGNDPDQLPLLQHALMGFYTIKQRENPDQTHLDYTEFKRIGGLQQALDSHAQKAYNELKPNQQAIAETLFKALTERSDEGQEIRRPLAVRDALQLTQTDLPELIKVIDGFRQEGRNFLMPPPDVELDKDSVVDISHESLIRQWQTLKDWVADESDKAAMLMRLTEAAQRYADKEGELWQGADLAQGLKWQKEKQPDAVWAARYLDDAGERNSSSFSSSSSSSSFPNSIWERSQEIPFPVKPQEEQQATQTNTGNGISSEHSQTGVWEREGTGVWERDWQQAIAFLKASQQAEQQQLAQQEAQRQQEISRMRRQVLFAVIGLIVAGVLALWGNIQRQNAETAAQQANTAKQRAQQAESRAELAKQKSIESLFDSTLTHASLLTKVEDYAEAHKKLQNTRKLDKDIAPHRRHARDLLSGFVAIMGGQGEDFYIADNKLTGNITLSPDNQWLAASGEQGTLLLFDMSDNATDPPEPQRLEGHDGSASSEGIVFDLVFHPNKDWLYSAGADGQIIRWQLPEQGQPAKIMQQWQVNAGEANALAISADGKLLASGHDDGIIRLWQAETGVKIAELHGHEGLISSGGLRFSHSNRKDKQLASASYDNTLRLWDVAKLLAADCSQSTLCEISAKKENEAKDNNGDAPVFRTSTQATVLRGHTNKISGLAYGNNGKWLASASDDKTIRLWDTETGQSISSPLKGHKNQVFALQFIPRNTPDSPHQQWLLASASSDNTIRLWDINSGMTLRVLQGHTAGVTALALANNGKLYSASNDAHIKRWSVGLAQQWLVDFQQELASAAIAPDGKHIAVGLANGTLQYYRLGLTPPFTKEMGLQPRNSEAKASLPIVNKEGNKKAAIIQLLAEDKQAHDAKIKRLAFNADGTQLASGSMDNKAKIWTITPKGKLQLHKTIEDHSNIVHAVSFSPDNKTLATASFDGKVGLFAVNGEEKQLFNAHSLKSGGVNAISFGKDNMRLLSTGYQDQQTKLWNLNTQPPSLINSYPAKDKLLWSSLSPDGKWIASVGRELIVKLHDTQNQQKSLSFIGHEQTVLKVLFSPDSHQLATVSADMTVRIWDIDTQSELFSLRFPDQWDMSKFSSPLWDFDFRCTPTGCWIAVPLTSGKLALYNLGKIDYSTKP